jgi:hypothetical protein
MRTQQKQANGFIMLLSTKEKRHRIPPPTDIAVDTMTKRRPPSSSLKKITMNMASCFVFSIIFSFGFLFSTSCQAAVIINSIADDLQYDDNDRLMKHTFVYDASSPTCNGIVPKNILRRLKSNPHEGSRFDVMGVQGDAYEKVLRPYEDKMKKNDDNGVPGCLAACIQRGVPKELATFVMPDNVYDSTTIDDQTSLNDWFGAQCASVEVCIMNYHSATSPLKSYWKQPHDGELKFQMDIGFGERHTRCFNSFIGHEFVFRDESDPENPVVVGELTVDFTVVKAWGNSPPSDERAPAHDFDREIENTLRYEWTRHE